MDDVKTSADCIAKIEWDISVMANDVDYSHGNRIVTMVGKEGKVNVRGPFLKSGRHI